MDFKNFCSVQSLSHVQLFATPWTAACQTSLSITNSWSLLKFMSIESVVASNHLILCHHLLLLPSVFPSISSVQFSCSFVSNSRLPCPSPTPRPYSNWCPSSRWCHPTVSSSVIPFSSCHQSFPESGSFQRSQFFTSGGQSIGVSASASVLPMNIQDWLPLRWTGWISLQSKGLSRVFSNTTVQKHQFFGPQPYL